MSDSAQTLRGAGPGPVREAALEIARSKIGERETLPPGPDGKPLRNQGPIVELVSRPFLSAHRFAEWLPAGKLLWCAFFVCWCILEALRQRGDEVLIKAWMRIASGSSTTLWENLCAQGDDDQGWAWLAEGGQAPAAGDLAFYGRYVVEDGVTVLKMHHVGFVERSGPEGDHTIEGNAGPKADRVYVGERAPDEAIGYARVPW